MDPGPSLSATSCCDLLAFLFILLLVVGSHAADVDPSLPFSSLLVVFPCGFGDFGLVVLLITSGCPIAHPAAFGRPACACSFFLF